MTPTKAIFMKLIFLLLHAGTGAQSDAPMHAGVSECGSKFTDPASRALLADIVLQGTIESLRQASLLSPLLYKANVTVHKVYKGQGLLRSRDDPVRVDVERFGLEENKAECIAKGSRGLTFLFFAKIQDSLPSSAASPFERTLSDVPLLINTALPVEPDLDILRQVKRVLCTGCGAAPVIKVLHCQNCAVKPSMTRKMAGDDIKMVTEGKSLSLRCVARGSPRPNYAWFKDGVLLRPSSSPAEDSSVVTAASRLSIHTTSRYSLLGIKRLTPDDGGLYRCVASNAAGDAEQQVQVKVQDRPSSAAQAADVDPCAVNPCHNGGRCAVEGPYRGRMICICTPAFTGRRCQLPRRRLQPDREPGVEGTNDRSSEEDDVELRRTFSTAESSDRSVETFARENQDEDDSRNDKLDDSTSSAPPDSRAATFSWNPHEASTTTTSTTTPTTTTTTPTTAATTLPITSAADPLSQKKLRKHKDYAVGSSRHHYGADPGAGEDAKTSKVVIPQLKVSECPETDYCLNNGRCKLVVKLQRRFCECQTGFAGRRCEIPVL